MLVNLFATIAPQCAIPSSVLMRHNAPATLSSTPLFVYRFFAARCVELFWYWLSHLKSRNIVRFVKKKTGCFYYNCYFFYALAKLTKFLCFQSCKFISLDNGLSVS